MRSVALCVGGRWGKLLSPDLQGVELPPEDSEDWTGFERDVDRQCGLLARLAALGTVSLLLVWWPLDRLFLRREPAAQALFTGWRLYELAVLGAMALALTVVPTVRRFPALCTAPFSMAAAAGLAYFVGGLGGLEQPFFYMIVAVLILPAGAPLALPQRALYHSALAAALLFGFFGLRPANLQSALMPEALSHLGSLVVATVMLGHVLYVGTCHRYFQGLRSTRTSLELAQLNRSLDERIALKTAQLAQLTEHLLVAQDEERGHIARELHDELGQRLSALRFTLANTRRRYGRAPATILPNLQELDVMLEATLVCTGTIVSGLRPPLLDQLGLAAAVEWLAQKTARQTGLRLELDIAVARECGSAVSVAAYRVFQESLTNVRRHAEATSVTVRLRASEHQLLLEVSDDGKGFPQAVSARPTDRNGLLGMRERAFALGGELVAENAAEGGARVKLTLPLPPREEAVAS